MLCTSVHVAPSSGVSVSSTPISIRCLRGNQIVAPATLPPPAGSLLLRRTPFASERHAAAPTPPPPIPMYVIAISSRSTLHEEIPAGNRDPSRLKSTVSGRRRYRIVEPTHLTSRTIGLCA